MWTSPRYNVLTASITGLMFFFFFFFFFWHPLTHINTYHPPTLRRCRVTIALPDLPGGTWPVLLEPVSGFGYTRAMPPVNQPSINVK